MHIHENKLKKYNRDYEEDLAKYRENPDKGEIDDDKEDDDGRNYIVKPVKSDHVSVNRGGLYWQVVA